MEVIPAAAAVGYPGIPDLVPADSRLWARRVAYLA